MVMVKTGLTWGQGGLVDTVGSQRVIAGIKRNKYAIHAYTHGPMTGSGPVWSK